MNLFEAQNKDLCTASQTSLTGIKLSANQASDKDTG